MRTLTMPDHSVVVPGYQLHDEVTDEQDIAYNQECNRLILAALAEDDSLVPTVKTHYPFDAPDGSTDDTLGLGLEGEIIVLDTGAA